MTATAERQLRAALDARGVPGPPPGHGLFGIASPFGFHPMADRDMFRRVAEALGLPHLSPKCMRRTYMDLARAAGVSGIVVRSIAGHSSERLTDLYSTVSDDERRAAGASVVKMTKPKED